MTQAKIRLRSRGSSRRAATGSDGSHSSSVPESSSKVTLPRWLRIIGWLVIFVVVIGLVSWLQGLDEDLRRALVEECQAAGREDCRFEQRRRTRRPFNTADGYFPGDGIVGYSRWTPVLKQFAAGFAGLVIGNRLFGRRPFAK